MLNAASLAYLHTLALKAYAGDTDKATAWVLTPSHLFFDLAPIEVTLKGSQSAIEVLQEWLGIP